LRGKIVLSRMMRKEVILVGDRRIRRIRRRVRRMKMIEMGEVIRIEEVRVIMEIILGIRTIVVTKGTFEMVQVN